MGRKVIKSLWNRQNLLDINNNFTELYDNVEDATTKVSEEFQKRIEEYENKELEDNSIVGDKLVDNTITPEKTSFIRSSKNLFDNKKLLNNSYTNLVTGVIESKSGWITTPFIEVQSGMNYARNKKAEIVTYDKDKNYYGSYGNSAEIVKFAKDVKYVRLNIESKNVAGFQFEQADQSTDYETYGFKSESLKIDSNNLDKNSVNTSNIIDRSITKDKTDFIVESENLFNNQNLTFNKKLSDVNTFTDDINYVVSDYITVVEDETYGTNNKYYGYVLYDANKNYITGRGQYVDDVTIPKGAKYIRLTIGWSVFNFITLNQQILALIPQELKINQLYQKNYPTNFLLIDKHFLKRMITKIIAF